MDEQKAEGNHKKKSQSFSKFLNQETNGHELKERYTGESSDNSRATGHQVCF
jgi:hypothetical protein